MAEAEMQHEENGCYWKEQNDDEDVAMLIGVPQRR